MKRVYAAHGWRPMVRMACLLLALGAQAAASQEISPAETLLFETDHLAQIKLPATLVYTFRKDSNFEPGFKDEVRLELTRIDGKLNATLHFLSGSRKQAMPSMEEVHGNPVLLGFLEHDIAEMQRLTGGSTSYFRKRIRMALAQGAELSVEPVSYQGRTVQAQAVRIQPYLNDPMRARFENYLHKTYTFVLSTQVPGGLYQMRSSLQKPDIVRTGAAPAAVPAIDETLTLIRATSHRP